MKRCDIRTLSESISFVFLVWYYVSRVNCLCKFAPSVSPCASIGVALRSHFEFWFACCSFRVCLYDFAIFVATLVHLFLPPLVNVAYFHEGVVWFMRCVMASFLSHDLIVGIRCLLYNCARLGFFSQAPFRAPNLSYLFKHVSLEFFTCGFWPFCVCREYVVAGRTDTFQSCIRIFIGIDLTRGIFCLNGPHAVLACVGLCIYAVRVLCSRDDVFRRNPPPLAYFIWLSGVARVFRFLLVFIRHLCRLFPLYVLYSIGNSLAIL